MTQRAVASCYADMPFSQVLFRYLWPFWLLKDATQGDPFARAAAYRHNRDMRVYLPGYLMKWMCSSAFMLGLTIEFESLSAHADRAPDVFILMAAGTGMIFACAVAVLFVTGYIYLYLSRNGE